MLKRENQNNNNNNNNSNLMGKVQAIQTQFRADKIAVINKENSKLDMKVLTTEVNTQPSLTSK